MQKQILEFVHAIEAGFGRDKTREKLANRFFWTKCQKV